MIYKTHILATKWIDKFAETHKQDKGLNRINIKTTEIDRWMTKGKGTYHRRRELNASWGRLRGLNHALRPYRNAEAWACEQERDTPKHHHPHFRLDSRAAVTVIPRFYSPSWSSDSINCDRMGVGSPQPASVCFEVNWEWSKSVGVMTKPISSLHPTRPEYVGSGSGFPI